MNSDSIHWQLRLCFLTFFASLSIVHTALSKGVEWSVVDGWLTADTAGKPILKRGTGSAVEITVDDSPRIGKRAISPQVTATPKGGFAATYLLESGSLVDRYDPFPRLGQEAWLRTLVYTNTSQKSQDIHGAVMRVAPVSVAKELTWNPRDFWMGQVSSNQSVCVSFRGSKDQYRLSVDRKQHVTHRVTACWRLAPGAQAVVDAQGIWLAFGAENKFRKEAQRWFNAIDLRVPDDVPAWLPQTILYEVCAGGHIDSRFSDVGGFDRLRRQVDYLADLGVDAVWLQAPHRHKEPPNPVVGGWNHYNPLDVSKIDPILGGPTALKQLADAFRASGIRVFGELVPHGGNSVQARALERWWTCGRDGQPKRTWGGCAMDYSSPPWQAVMRTSAARLSREFGMVGARVDVADGSGPNWRSPRTNHASLSTLGGAVEMLGAIRAGMSEGATSPVLIPEASNTVEFFRICPVGYDHPGWFLLAGDIPPLIDRPAQMANKIRDFYELQRGALPAGARLLRTLNNHDTTCHYGRVDFRYGVGLANALYGICLMVPGVPMMYQEEELGCYETRRRLNWARRRIPEFANGNVDYAAVTYSPTVFACLRQTDNGSAIGLANLSGDSLTGNVQLATDIDIPDSTHVYDAVTGRTAILLRNQFEWQLAPYETSLIRVGRRPNGEIPAERFAGERSNTLQKPSRFNVDANGNGVQLRVGQLTAIVRTEHNNWTVKRDQNGSFQLSSNEGWIHASSQENVWHFKVELKASKKAQIPEIVVFNADRWHLSGRTALLSDRVMRRHFPFPKSVDYRWDRTMAWGSGPHSLLYNKTAPSGRLWQSVLEPLHPDQPAWAVHDRDGTSLIFSNITSNAENTVLTDRSDESHPEPYGLAFQFRSIDQDLNPRLATVGWDPWTMDSYPHDQEKSVSVQFTVACGDQKNAVALLNATRLPVHRVRATVSASAGQFNESNDAIWLIEPGTFTWTNLKPPTNGTHRIRFELRHSESSETGTDLEQAYEIRIDDEVVPIEWVKHNTWQTGNAYFGYAMTPPLDLSTRARKIQIRSRKTWCAIRGGFHVASP